MPDETPTGDRAVYVFIEMIALGFVLYSIEEAFKDKPSWAKFAIALALGLIFFILGVKWTTLKTKIHFSLAGRIDRLANDYRYRYGLALFLIGIFSTYVLISINSLRRDFDTRFGQRKISKQEVERLRDYLSRHESSAITIRVVKHDPEAMEYAAQLFNALRETNWDVDPPNHGGPDYIALDPYVKRPKVDDKDNMGNRIFKTVDSYRDAHDSWIESEIKRSIDEQTYDISGLAIEVFMTGQPTNPDPRHPTPDSVLADAFRYAGIEVNGGGGAYDRQKNGMFLYVGHRVQGNGEMPLLFKIGRWVERLGQ